MLWYKTKHKLTKKQVCGQKTSINKKDPYK